ncbi:uncharacterized protein LOC123873453 [Maniola jurtina]|uniref:uncharacterized protein LOC123873453 n=1 Tax=Maniola jurtina TaxID=191418 RepID=UPI001E686B6A|nr:uncharacterized protein LOC123873453 [Maniola jurtina]
MNSETHFIHNIENEGNTIREEWHELDILNAIKRLKTEKSTGPDNIPNEAIKYAADILITPIYKLFKLIIIQESVPHQWVESHITLLYKKGDPKDVQNYRPISLMCSLYKLFSSCLLSKISDQIDLNQPKEQAGFRKGFSTMDHIHTWKWAGHIARLQDERWTQKVTTWIGPQGKRRRGRPNSRWADDIISVAGRDWKELAKNRKNWSVLEEAYTQEGFSSSH